MSSRRVTMRALLLGIVVSVAVSALARVGVFAGWETRVLDTFVFWRDRVQAPEVILVTIDDAAFRELGERQPLSRLYLADLGELLLRSGARVVAFDILVKTPSIAEEDAVLVSRLHRWQDPSAGRVVFASLVLPTDGHDPKTYEMVLPFFSEPSVLLGFANTLVGTDGVVRRMVLTLPSREGQLLPSFTLAVLAGYAGYTQQRFSETLASRHSDGLSLPTRTGEGIDSDQARVSPKVLANNPWRIDFVGPPGSFTSFPSGPLIAMARSGVPPAPDNPFRGRIVLVGATFQDSRELYPTPVGLMTGVEIHANMINTALSQRFVNPPPWPLTLSLSVGACLVIALLSVWIHPRWLMLAGLCLIGVLAVASYTVYTRGGYWLDIGPALVGMLGYIEASSILRRRRLRTAFGAYASPDVMDAVLRAGTDLQGQLRTVTVLMSDLRGFTALCERTAPSQISAMMNEYLGAMVKPIMANRGIVIDFAGDGILAVYGAPADDPDHAWHAVRSAVRMQAALEQLNTCWQQSDGGSLSMGIAVHTGEVFAGTVGSSAKKKYAVLGDTVNTTARVEGLNRDLETAILITEATRVVVNDRIVVRDRGSMVLKGKAAPTRVFELLRLAIPTEDASP